MNSQHFCFLDLETTGFDPLNDSILELALLRFHQGSLVQEINQIYAPDKSALSPTVSQITQISASMVEASGIKFSDQKVEINEAVADTVIIGHNIGFDIQFLQANGITLDPKSYIDTHQLARIVLVGEESYALEILSQKYGLLHQEAHRAMSDVIASKALFEFLLERIKTLPKEYLESIRVLLDSSDWFAKIYFQEALEKGYQKAFSLPKTPPLPQPKASEISDFSLPKTGQMLQLRIDTAEDFKKALWGIFERFPTEKFLLITSRESFFPEIQTLYKPQEVLSPERLEILSQSQRARSNHNTLVFCLKLKLRSLFGFITKKESDLFWDERILWEEINHQSLEAEEYKVFLEQTLKTRLLQIAPKSFLGLFEKGFFQDRILIVDEGESFVEHLLFHPTKTHSLRPFLEHADEKISTQTHFFIRDFCQQVLEKELDHTLNPFAVRVRLPQCAYKALAEKALKIAPDQKDLQDFSNTLLSPEKSDLRWAFYNPENGHLSLETWSKSDHESLKKSLEKERIILTHRINSVAAGNLFTHLFSDSIIQGPNLTPIKPKRFEVPLDLMSANSPDYLKYCAHKIWDLFQSECPQEGFIAVNGSSFTTLRGIYEELIPLTQNEKILILGERISGGNGKVSELLLRAKNDRGIFLFQEFSDPVLQAIPFKTFCLQKFPFAMPHPLLEYLEESMAKNQKSFWDIFTLPLVASRLGKNLSLFSHPLKLIMLDPRENAPWAKGLWKLLG